MLLGGNLQHSWDRLGVRINCVPDHLCNELVDENDANVITAQEAPGDKEQEGRVTTCGKPTWEMDTFSWVSMQVQSRQGKGQTTYSSKILRGQDRSSRKSKLVRPWHHAQSYHKVKSMTDCVS